ncbi:hypothetical protein MTR_1g075137 [Medicago truncatula]|uniref:Transmembrane protein n=1 Tax=Medicago truncatula TaxID=3880 RepID=A0A072VXC7_MEDTR|nr:hypothetical protein MTR_1g075137 [Medicago truncatula]
MAFLIIEKRFFFFGLWRLLLLSKRVGRLLILLQMGFTGTNAIRVEGFNIEQVGIHGVCLDFLNLERALNIVVMTEIKRSLIFLYDFFASDRIHEWRDIRKTQKFWKKQ